MEEHKSQKSAFAIIKLKKVIKQDSQINQVDQPEKELSNITKSIKDLQSVFGGRRSILVDQNNLITIDKAAQEDGLDGIKEESDNSSDEEGEPKKSFIQMIFDTQV